MHEVVGVSGEEIAPKPKGVVVPPEMSFLTTEEHNFVCFLSFTDSVCFLLVFGRAQVWCTHDGAV